MKIKYAIVVIKIKAAICYHYFDTPNVLFVKKNPTS